jgi:stress responsive alpha/beta barrel protein
MIAHVILFRPRPDLTEARRRETLDAFVTAVNSVPTVRRVRIGRRVRHGRPGYEQAMREDFQYAAVIEFDDLTGLTAYLEHPAHLGAAAHFTSSGATALAYDYEMVDTAAAGSFL